MVTKPWLPSHVYQPWALMCEPQLEGNPNMSWLLAALLSMFVGSPAPDCTIIEFTVENCGPCRQLQPALEKLRSEGWDIRTVDAARERELVKQHAIESLPTLVLVSNGKEVDRIVGAAPYEKILPRLAKLLLASNANSLNNSNAKIDAPRISAPQLIDPAPAQLGRTAPAAAAENWQASQPKPLNRSNSDSGITVRGQSPAGAFPMLALSTNSAISSAPSSSAIAEKFEKLNSPQNSTQNSSVNQLISNTSPGRSLEPAATNLRQPDRLPQQQLQPLPVSRNAAPIDLQKAIARAEAATVRIRVDEENTTAYGTGTVIDVHGDEALVLTCGHLFREMKPHSQLTIDLFAGRAQPLNIPAQLIDFRADAGDVDIGLVSFKLPFAIEPVPLLPASEALEVRQSAFSFGCDHGANPTRRDTQIKSINRYLGAPNVEIDGAPAVGRSGGGLFDHHGRLIGVCNAADAAGDEGIYAAAEIVYAQIERLQLPHLFNNTTHQTQPAQVATTQVGSPQVVTAQATGPASPAMNSFASQQEQVNPGQLFEDSLDQPTVAQASRQAAEATVGVSQLTCIVRDAAGREQVVRIDAPTPELLGEIYRYANGENDAVVR